MIAPTVSVEAKFEAPEVVQRAAVERDARGVIETGSLLLVPVLSNVIAAPGLSTTAATPVVEVPGVNVGDVPVKLAAFAIISGMTDDPRLFWNVTIGLAAADTETRSGC